MRHGELYTTPGDPETMEPLVSEDVEVPAAVDDGLEVGFVWEASVPLDVEPDDLNPVCSPMSCGCAMLGGSCTAPRRLTLMAYQRRRLLVAIAALAIVAAACSSDASDTAAGSAEGPTRMAVEADVVSDPSTGAVSVWSPGGGGPWPVIMLLHGLDGDRDDVEVLGRALAAEGHTVFAPTWVLDADVQRQLTCAHRLAQTQAAAYRGDASRPVSFVGHSAGASFAIGGSLFEIPIPADACFEPVPPPTVVVALAPCRFEEDLAGVADRDPSIVVVSAQDDVVCPPEQQRDTVNRLVDAGIDAALVTVEAADHWSVAFRALSEGQVVDDPSSADGRRAVEIIVDAIATAGT